MKNTGGMNSARGTESTRGMELVSPAGNFEKLKTSYLYGADAAYIGIKGFSLRMRADNFHREEHEEIQGIKGGKKLYAALNIYFHQEDLKALEEELEYLARYPLDGLIVSDMGILSLIRRRFPDMPLHLSTQANCINSEAARFYQDLGFQRIILGRESSLAEIKAIRDGVDLELEVFVHGAMCLAYSGRCFLSRYMADRSANQGDCAHSCRWEYRLLEEKERPGEHYPIFEGDGFTTILSSKDLCMIDHMEELQQSGVDAVKIEGRMKSVYYAAVVTRAYRKALDSLAGEPVENLQAYKDEIYKVSHREFSTGFYFGSEEIETPTETAYRRSHVFLGSILARVDEDVYRIDVKNQIRETDVLEYIGYDVISIEDGGFELLDENRRWVEKIDHGKIAYLRTDKPVKEGYIMRKWLAGA
jgi:putative protease